MTMQMLLARRRMMMPQGGGMPYDSKVEYIGSSGTQYIDTGIYTGDHIFDVQIRVQPYNAASVNSVLCVTYNDISQRVWLLDYQGNTYRVANIKGSWNFNSTAHLPLDVGTFSDIETQLSKSQTSITIGGTTATSSNSVDTIPSTLTYYLFARNASGTATSFSTCDIAYCKIYQDGTLVRDFIPVRVGQVGYMYDRVSGQLFGNLGTGDFTLGADVV